MTKPDFEKIFASSGATLPLTDSQFLQGFAYLGENPPTKEEFNWLFQQLCLKMQWLNQNAGFGRWQAEHAYTAGEICFSSVIGDFRLAECTVGGQSGTAEPTWGAVGSTVADGGVTWVVRDLRQGTSIGKIPALVDVGGGKAGLPAVSGKLLTDISGMPIGSVVPFLATKAQPGWLACDTGALVSRATYPELWTWVQANAPLISETDWQTQAAAQSSVGAYSTGDGSTTFRLPRILDYVRGGLIADVGKWQGDAIRNITGSLNNTVEGMTQANVSNTEMLGALKISDAKSVSSYGSTTGENAMKVSFDASLVVPTADENRPKTIKFLCCVKAFDVTTNQGLIDITALANEVAGKQKALAYIRIWDEKASGTAGGTFTSGAWRTRDLNQKQVIGMSADAVTVATNQFTLPAGTYEITGSAPAHICDNHKIRLQNITDSKTEILGSSERSAYGNSTQTRSFLSGAITITAAKTFEMQHYCMTTGMFGNSTNISGINEIYAIVEIRKVG